MAPTRIASAEIRRDVDAGKSTQFDCNWLGSTTATITNETGAPAPFNIRFAGNQNISGTVAPMTSKSVVVGCGGLFTPGLVFDNLSGVKVHVKTQ
jgi:hypothetical protein